jgi:hypothetical protein
VEAIGQDMLDETSQKLDALDGHRLVSSRSKRNMFIVHIHHATIGNPHSMGIATEVLQDVLRSTECRLGVRVPGLLWQRVDEL